MADAKQRIAGELERGFAEQGVEALRAQADVSLRALYKYFPSREAMILGALEHRDRVHFDRLDGGPDTGVDHVLHLLVRLGDRLAEVANTGCLFRNALAEHPDSAPIAAAVREHEEKLADEFRIRLEHIEPGQDTAHLAETLFLLHEGMTQAARLQGGSGPARPRCAPPAPPCPPRTSASTAEPDRSPAWRFAKCTSTPTTCRCGTRRGSWPAAPCGRWRPRWCASSPKTAPKGGARPARSGRPTPKRTPRAPAPR